MTVLCPPLFPPGTKRISWALRGRERTRRPPDRHAPEAPEANRLNVGSVMLRSLPPAPKPPRCHPAPPAGGTTACSSSDSMLSTGCDRVSCQSAVRFTPFPPPPPSGHIPASRPSRSARRPARQPPDRVPRPTRGDPAVARFLGCVAVGVSQPRKNSCLLTAHDEYSPTPPSPHPARRDRHPVATW